MNTNYRKALLLNKSQELAQAARAKIAEARSIIDRYEGVVAPVSARTQITALAKEAKELKEQSDEAYKIEPATRSVTSYDNPTVRGIDGKTYKPGMESMNENKSMWLPEGATFKDVSGGGLNLPEAFDSDIATDPRQSRFLQGMLSKKPVTGGNAFAFLRQSLRDNQAAFVAPHAAKPVSPYETERVEDKIEVVAHVSEPQDRYDLIDGPYLGDFLEEEMKLGLDLAIEAHVVAQILADADVATVAFDTDHIVTIRKAKTALAKNYVEPKVLAINPDDAETLDLSADANGRFYFAGPSEADASPAWSVPVLQTNAVTTGVGIMGDLLQGVRLYGDQRVLIDSTEQGLRANSPATVEEAEDLFIHNEVRLRAETRVKAAIRKPFCMVEIDLTAV